MIGSPSIIGVLLALLNVGAPVDVWSASSSQIHILGTAAGEDWSLPDDTRPLPDTGLFTMDDSAEHPLIRHQGYTLTWAELNPKEGEYDWTAIWTRLNQAAERDGAVVFRLKANVVMRESRWGPLHAIPKWVLAKHAPPIVIMRDQGPHDHIRVAVPWDPGLQKEHLAFIQAFGRQGFHRHQSFLGLYVHGISSSVGEELWANGLAWQNLAAAGMTAERLQRAFMKRLDGWAKAFGDQVHRLAWVGAEWFDAPENDSERYRDMARQLNQYATTLGMGRRWGHIEHYHAFFDHDGQKLDANGHMSAEVTHSLIAQHRFWGAENENYDVRTPASIARHRYATLRALQMGMRLLWIEPAMIDADPIIARYFVLNAGKAASDAPDAFAVLREAQIRHRGKRVVLKNFERFVRQRDIEGAYTKPARWTPRAPFFNDWSEPADWTARSTDLAADQRRIAFTVDPKFLNFRASSEVILKVTWIDNGPVWRLEAGGSKSDWIRETSDGSMKTTTLRLNQSVVDQELADGDFDFSFVTNEHDLTISVVRLIKHPSKHASFRLRSGDRLTETSD